MNLGERDYKITDEQVIALGFSSYEELEQYYDLLYSCMGNRPWDKLECEKALRIMGLKHRLDYSRQDRLKSVIDDNIGVIKDWNDTTNQPTLDEISIAKDGLTKSLDVYFRFVEKQARMEREKTSPHM